MVFARSASENAPDLLTNPEIPLEVTKRSTELLSMLRASERAASGTPLLCALAANWALIWSFSEAWTDLKSMVESRPTSSPSVSAVWSKEAAW